MRVIRIVFCGLVGLAFGIVSGFVLVPAFAAFAGDGGGTWPFFVVAAAGALFGFTAPTVRRAFGRGFLMAGVCTLALPVSMLLLSSRVADEMITAASADTQAATAVGAGLAGMVMTGASWFIGLAVGSILIIVGLVLALGGRREVVVVARRD